MMCNIGWISIENECRPDDKALVWVTCMMMGGTVPYVFEGLYVKEFDLWETTNHGIYHCNVVYWMPRQPRPAPPADVIAD